MKSGVPAQRLAISLYSAQTVDLCLLFKPCCSIGQAQCTGPQRDRTRTRNSRALLASPVSAVFFLLYSRFAPRPHFLFSALLYALSPYVGTVTSGAVVVVWVAEKWKNGQKCIHF
jgi:hypothetical protein